MSLSPSWRRAAPGLGPRSPSRRSPSSGSTKLTHAHTLPPVKGSGEAKAGARQH